MTYSTKLITLGCIYIIPIEIQCNVLRNYQMVQVTGRGCYYKIHDRGNWRKLDETVFKFTPHETVLIK